MSKIYGVPIDKVSKLFIDLDNNNINYLVLRWYEDLPLVKAGEDIDILVADKDFTKIKKFLKRGRALDKNFVKIDLFPESSQKRFMAYYPPRIAKKMLLNKIKHVSNAYIPMPKDYFFSLTYHVLFHKGFNSGIKSKYHNSKITTPEHDYNSYLIGLMKSLNMDSTSLTLEGLELILEKENWLPPLDVYFRRSNKNKWVYYRALDKIHPEWTKMNGLVVFIIREKGAYDSVVKKLRELIITNNAEIISTHILSEKQALLFAENSRGGDWGKGPSPRSGGLPKHIIVCKKEHDSKLKKTEKIPQGVVEYNWVKNIKTEIREYYLDSTKRSERCNILHSSDNGIEASHYIDLLNKIIKKNEK